MANHSATKKHIRQTVRRTLVNKMRLSKVRTCIRRCEDALKAKDKTAAENAFKLLEPEIMRAAQKNLLHSNQASRKVSRIRARVKALSA